MKYLKTYQLFEAKIKVRSWEKKEIYRDDNIVVIVPLTHNALTKYAIHCQWCINDDVYEFEEYHKGMVLIIQRKPLETRIGVTGKSTADEIFNFSKLIEGDFDWDFIKTHLEHDFKDLEEVKTYFNSLIRDINNFRLSVVYHNYNEGGKEPMLVDMSDNYFSNYDHKIIDIPNITPEAINSINRYKEENEYSGEYNHIK